MKNSSITDTTQLYIQGLIQGVGFRPFIYRLAKEFKLYGIIYNQNNGVVVQVQGKTENINKFIRSIKPRVPRAAKIDRIEKSQIRVNEFSSFSIQQSKKTDNSITQVSPDIAVCEDCLNDIKTQTHRIGYPFTNCTNCGPRFSIIENIPYDREQTSMRNFVMCPDCYKEYNDVTDRRFHAQPVACNNCGPVYILQTAESSITSINKILTSLNALFKNSGIVAMKGLGGYHLACNAFNAHAVDKLRKIKERDGKPFALMFSSISSLKKHSTISKQEEKLLTSWERPIVLVKSKSKLPHGIAGNLTTLGVFLPYLPFHHQLFEAIETEALVMTSGNISDCPIIIENELAIKTFKQETDAILTHNRDIINRVDDSVVHKIGNNIQIIRRSRGYAPAPVRLNFNTEGILATGAELSNAFCIGKGEQAILSQHIGDLKNLETMNFFETSIDAYKRLFKFKPAYLACDMHPEYLSAKYARNMGLPVIETQHHHAHIASCMAEYGIDEPVIGISYDGTGYGADGKTWGSEIMIASFSGFERKYHFEYVPVPGGDKISKEPWRSALSYLTMAFEDEIPNKLSFLQTINARQKELTLIALKQKINTPESCSAGRLFDAVSALTDICVHAKYHAEAPILLEHNLQPGIKEKYSIELNSIICWRKTIKSIVKDIQNKVPTPVISAKFHNTVIHITMKAIKKIHHETGINKVILTGGTFQNKYLSEKLLVLLAQTGLKVYMPQQTPVNDGGIALGQLAIAAKKLTLCV